MEPLKPKDLQTILGWLSPDYLIPAAMDHGLDVAMFFYGEDGYRQLLREVSEDSRFLAVYGARGALNEARNLIRNYGTFVRKREKVKARDLGLAQMLRAAGYVGNFQAVAALPQVDWRKTSQAFWPQGEGTIPGDLWLEVGDASQRQVDMVSIQVISEMLLHLPECNRAILQGRVWRRLTGHVMVHLMPAPEQVRSVIVDASRCEDLRSWLSRAIKSMVRAERHEFRPFADQLLQAWAKTGFIASPAGAMISCAGSTGVYKGKAALLARVNGVPLAFTIGRVENGKVWITADVDHRAIDGPQMGKCYRYLEQRIPERLCQVTYKREH